MRTSGIIVSKEIPPHTTGSLTPKKMIQMTVYDQVKYNGYVCTVEQVWEADDVDHTPFCAIRPVEPQTEGTFYVEQSATRPYIH